MSSCPLPMNDHYYRSDGRSPHMPLPSINSLVLLQSDSFLPHSAITYQSPHSHLPQRPEYAPSTSRKTLAHLCAPAAPFEIPVPPPVIFTNPDHAWPEPFYPSPATLLTTPTTLSDREVPLGNVKRKSPESGDAQYGPTNLALEPKLAVEKRYPCPGCNTSFERPSQLRQVYAVRSI